MSTVFVGNIAWAVKEDGLRTFLGPVGKIVDVQVQVHADSGRSKGWALVTFDSPQEAQRAIESYNGKELDGRRVHIREDRSGIDSVEGVVVFVGNLPWAINSSAVQELFAPYSPLDVHVKTNMTGKSRGFALVKFPDVKSAENAIRDLHSFDLNGRRIQVRLDRAHADIDESLAAPDVSESVAVGNLSWDTTEDRLQAHMSSVGTVVRCEIQRHSDTNKSKGWAIVAYSSPKEAADAISTLHRTSLANRSLNIRYYKPAEGLAT